MAHRQQERLCHRCQLKLIAYSPSFPTCMSHLGSVPLLCSTVLWLPHFLSGLQQQGRHEVLEHCSCSLTPSGNQFQQFSHPERIAHGPDNPPLQYPTGLTTRFFSPAPKLTSYTNKYGYGYRFRYNDMKVRRLEQWVCECSWMIYWVTE
jgi:hypothetical protein